MMRQAQVYYKDELAGEITETSEGYTFTYDPKLSVRFDRKQNTLLPVAEHGEYILKPQIQAFPHVPENEQCTLFPLFTRKHLSKNNLLRR